MGMSDGCGVSLQPLEKNRTLTQMMVLRDDKNHQGKSQVRFWHVL